MLGDIDVWKLDELRASGKYQTIDLIIAAYYEDTRDGFARQLTTARADAIARYLKYYGFTYDAYTDLPNYPVLTKQRSGAARVVRETAAFSKPWIMYQVAHRQSRLATRGDYADNTMIESVALTFMYWLEAAAAENGVQTSP